MPTFTELIQTPQVFDLDQVLAQNPQYMQRFIQYLTIPQDFLLSNERQCYLYPSKIADILSNGMAYRLLIIKKDVEDCQVYPFLWTIFKNIRDEETEPTLLGYSCKVLIALVKKTPEIYEFIKDNENVAVEILKDDVKVECLKQFIALFLTESTMEIYLFLKSMIIRNLIFRMVEDEGVSNSVYKCMDYFYEQTLKALEDVCQDEKHELEEVRKNFEDQNFITLLILKLDSTQHQKSVYIANFLCRVVPRSVQACQIVCLHIDTILDFLQDYEESSCFMEQIFPQHISILKLLVELVKMQKIKQQITSQIIKRLLVYSNVHTNNSQIHNLLFKTVVFCQEQAKRELIKGLNIIQFFSKSSTPQDYGFMSLRRRMIAFCLEHKFDEDLTEEQKQPLLKEYHSRQQQQRNSKYYKQIKIGSQQTNMGATKMPTSLQAMVKE